MSDKSWGVGEGLKTSYPNQVLLGRYNGEPPEGVLLVLGNGTADDARNTALVVNGDGDLEIDGDVIDGNRNYLSKAVIEDDNGDADVTRNFTADGLFAKINATIGTCETSASTRVKVITADGFEFVDGNYLVVKFTNAQTYSGDILFKVNNERNRYAYYNGAYITNTNGAWSANEIVVFRYIDNTSVGQRYERIDDGANDGQLLNGITALGWSEDCLETVEDETKYITVDSIYHGSWADSDSKVDGNVLYRSESSYNVSNAWDTAKIIFKGYTTFKLNIRSYAEGNYDYVLVSTLNNDYLASRTSTSAMRSAYNNTEYTKAYTRGKQSATNYEEVLFDGLDANTEYYFYVIYQKDGSGNSNDDRGYFYFDN